MAAKNKPKNEQKLSNDILKDVFRELHDTVVNNINTFSVIGKLFSAKVISTDDMDVLHFINNPREKCTRLLIILHKANNPRTFIELREAITTEESYEWLVETIDEKYNFLASPAAQPQVNQDSSNPSLTPPNGDTGDVTELNRVINDLKSVIAKLTTENSRLLEDNARLMKENYYATLLPASFYTTEIERLKEVLHQSRVELREYQSEMVKIVDALKMELESVRKSKSNPQLLFTLNQLPKFIKGYNPCHVAGVVMLDKYLYVAYNDYNKVQVFNCEARFKKIKDIEVKEMKSPWDMVGRSVTSQLFINDWLSDVIWRVGLKTGVSDVFIKTGYNNTSLSLVENRLLVTSPLFLLMFDIVSGERIKKIPLIGDSTRYSALHAIEYNIDSFFVCHGTSDSNTVSEIDSEGRVIRVFDNKQQLYCDHLALDSVGRLIATDWKNNQIVLFDEHLNYERILIDNKRLDNARPSILNFDKNNNRLAVGLDNGQVKIFEY